MIKKHLIACCVLLTLMISAKILVKRKAETHVNSFPQKVDFPSPREQKEAPSADRPASGQAAKPAFKFAKVKVPVHNRDVAVKMNRYLKANNFKHLQTGKLHQKAALWFPVIEPILKRHGIPEDFKYIPLVESGIEEGTSHSGASGYWQFMPQTARDYGLRVNGRVDERKDLQKSTIAACRYLKSLYGEFKNWVLVAAAYNVGENRLRQRIATQGHRNYFKMKLNRETASYVYKLVSMKEIIEHPLKYGFGESAKALIARQQGKVRPGVFINPAAGTNSLKVFAMSMPEAL